MLSVRRMDLFLQTRALARCFLVVVVAAVVFHFVQGSRFIRVRSVVVNVASGAGAEHS